MATNVDFRERPARFVELLDLTRSGTEVVVTDGAIPQARLVPVSSPGPRIPGLHAGLIDIAPNFDDPLPDDFWEGKS